MITQSFKNGVTEIKVENAESLEDAKKNNFPEGVYSRFYIDGKPATSYMSVISQIIGDTKKHGKNFIPQNNEGLKKMRDDMVKANEASMRDAYNQLRAKYKELGIPDSGIPNFGTMIDKTNLSGARVKE